MKANKNIEILVDKDDFVEIRTSCACMGHDCNVTFRVYTWPSPMNPNDQGMVLEAEGLFRWRDLEYEVWYEKIWYNFWNRVKAAFLILFTGYAEIEKDFTFRDKQHAIEFADAIKDVVERVKLNPDKTLSHP